MKTRLIALNFSDTPVRAIERDGEPWLVLSDICAVLEIKNPRDAASRLEDYQKLSLSREEMTRFLTVGNADGQKSAPSPFPDTGAKEARGGPQSMTVVNESGVYSLISRSRIAKARAFNRWLTTEVLPSIRKYGFYDPSRMGAAAAYDQESAYWDAGHSKSQQERFLEEIHRFQNDNNTSFTRVFEGIYPKAALKAVALGVTQPIHAFTKNRRWLYLLSAGFDLPYILWGKRTLTAAERQMRDALRLVSPEQRYALFLQVQHLKDHTPPLLPDTDPA
ncbi:MAG: BRO family protein [Asticcacaulis sp.]